MGFLKKGYSPKMCGLFFNIYYYVNPIIKPSVSFEAFIKLGMFCGKKQQEY